MKRKMMITFLIAVLTVMTSFVFATETLTYDTMLISEDAELIVDSALNSAKEDIILIAPNPNRNTISVQVDGEYIDFTDAEGNVVNPKIIQNRTMVPMRKIFEIFNAQINWDNETRTVVATTTEKEITLTIGNEIAKLKDFATEEEKEITLDSAPVILDNRTMVPVRFIAESLEKEVGWDAEQKTVVIIDLEKIVKDLEEKTPALKKLFELELEPMQAFKTNSEIEGKLVYKDLETKSNNETVKITGNLNVNMNLKKEIEIYLDLAFSGKGAIYNSLVEAGYNKLKAGIVIANSKAYMMMEQNGEEVWMDLGSSADMSALESLDATMTTPTNYEDFVKLLKTALGEMNSDTYYTLTQMVEVLSWCYSEEYMNISTSGNKATIKFDMDLKDVLAQITPEIVAMLGDSEFKISMVQKVEDKLVEKATIDFELALEQPSTEESFAIDFEIDMKYKDIDKDFEIVLPENVSERYE